MLFLYILYRNNVLCVAVSLKRLIINTLVFTLFFAFFLAFAIYKIYICTSN